MTVMPLDLIPLWCFFPLLFVSGILSIEVAYCFGKWRRIRSVDEKDSSIAAIVGATLGLLAFMLAFTFSLAATRFEARRQAVFDEANSIGTTYLRARLLPEPQRSEVAQTLRRYTEMRVQYIAERRIDELITQSEQLHEQLWSQGVMVAEKAPDSVMTGLFLQSLNETIDLHSKRVFVGLQSRIPFTIWLALFSLALLGMFSVGYQAGFSESRRSPVTTMLVLAFTGVLFLIVDLDRAQEGLLQVSQRSMTDLQRTMQP